MNPFVALLILLCIIIGEGVAGKAADKYGDKKQSTRYLCIGVYNIVTGLALLIIGDVSLSGHLSDNEELIFTCAKYIGIIWLVIGVVYGLIAIMQKQTENSKDVSKGIDSQESIEKTALAKKPGENSATTSGVYSNDRIPTWKRVEIESEECKNNVCIFCGASMTENQQFCGTCGKSRN